MGARFRKISKLFAKKSSPTEDPPKPDPLLRHSKSFSGPLPSYVPAVDHADVTTPEPPFTYGGRSHARTSSSTLGSELSDIILNFPRPPTPGLPEGDEFLPCLKAGLARQEKTYGSPLPPQRSASSASFYASRAARPQAPPITRRRQSEDLRQPESRRPVYQPRAGTPPPFINRPVKHVTTSSKDLSSTLKGPFHTYIPKQSPDGKSGPPPSKSFYSNTRHAQSSSALPPRVPHAKPIGGSSAHRMYTNTPASQSASSFGTYHTAYATSQQTLVSNDSSTSSTGTNSGYASTPPNSAISGPYKSHLRAEMQRSRAGSLAESARTGRSTIGSRGIQRPFDPVKFARSADSKWMEMPSKPIDIHVIGEDFGPVRRGAAQLESAETMPKTKAGGFKDKLRKLKPSLRK